jgi:hypothetical protein
MPEYRLYCLSDNGGFSKADEIEAGNDGEALARAKAMKLPANASCVSVAEWSQSSTLTPADQTTARKLAVELKAIYLEVASANPRL